MGGIDGHIEQVFAERQKLPGGQVLAQAAPGPAAKGLRPGLPAARPVSPRRKAAPYLPRPVLVQLPRMLWVPRLVLPALLASELRVARGLPLAMGFCLRVMRRS